MKKYLMGMALSGLIFSSAYAEELAGRITIRPTPITSNGQQYIGAVILTEKKDRSSISITEDLGNNQQYSSTFVDEKDDGTVDAYQEQLFLREGNMLKTIKREDEQKTTFDLKYKTMKDALKNNKKLKLEINFKLNKNLEEPKDSTETYKL